MAIPVVELVMSLRYALGDMQGLQISDYELIEPLNQAASELYKHMSERFVHEIVAEEGPFRLNASDTHEIPETFVRIYQVLGSSKAAPTDEDYQVIIPTSGRKPVFGAYRIVGRTFKAAKGTYIIEYFYIPKKVNTLSDELNVPESMRTWIEQLSLSYYKKDYATAAAIMQQCESVLAGRNISHFENTSPTQTLGRVTG